MSAREHTGAGRTLPLGSARPAPLSYVAALTASRHASERTPPAPAPRPAKGEDTAGLAAVMERGRILERHGQRDEARRLYEHTLRDGTVSTPRGAAQLLRLIARTYLLDADFTAAVDCTTAALAISELTDDEAGRGHAINILAIIEWKTGDLDLATRLYLDARASAQRAGDAHLAAMTATNLGIIATVRGNEADAMRYHESSLHDARAAGLADLALMALNNLGLLHTQHGRLHMADRAYAEALEIATVLGDLSGRILLELNIARLRIRQGDHRRARAACDAAMNLAQQLGDSHADGEAAHVYGVIARAAGELAKAEEYFLQADASAVARGDLILQGETARELADLYRSQGRNRQTLQRLNQAHRIFAQLRARRELADVDRRTAMLENDFLEVVRRWGESIEAKDRYTQGHCVRVADLACAVWARVHPGDQTSLFWFRIGALLHDVGKLMVPAEVLNKPGKLSPEEWEMVRRHPSAGVELLADIEFPWDVRPIVESHHERWDGKGYPHGLAGEEIPLSARVLCVADVYDALTSQRSYKKAFTREQALEIMRKDIGGQFDPAVFALFEETVHEHTWQMTPVTGLARSA